MIVTEKMAREAWDYLRPNIIEMFAASDVDFPPTAENVRVAFNCTAMRTHPDRGGTAEEFRETDRAKHILLEWLKREPEARPVHKPEVCPKCDGRGFIVRQHAWKAMRMQCPRCRGAGDLDTEHGGNDYDRTSS